MEYIVIVLAGLIAVVSTITISPNGNSPERKMSREIMSYTDTGTNLTHMTTVDQKTNYDKSKKMQLRPTKLSVNERYRRLIPYMTFYYANDLVSHTPEPFSTDGVEVQKVKIEQNSVPMTNSKKINYAPGRNIPRYHGNRPTKYNTAPVPVTAAYDPYVPPQHQINQDPLYLEQNFMTGHTFGRNTPKYSPNQNVPNLTQDERYQTQAHQQNVYNAENVADIQYYVADKAPQQKYKLVPYEQTSHLRYNQAPQKQHIIYYNRQKNIPVPVLTNSNTQFYAKHRNPGITYEETVQPVNNIHSYPITETYYDQRKPLYHVKPKLPQPESGFQPMIPQPRRPSIEKPVILTPVTAQPVPTRIHEHRIQTEATQPAYRPALVEPEYYNYAEVQSEPIHEDYSSKDSATLSDILATLQRSKSIPHPITKDNVGSSIRTLLHVLNTLKTAQHQQYNEVEGPVLSTPKPFAANPKTLQVAVVTEKPVVETESEPTDTTGLHGEEYLAPVNTPSQHLDDYRGSSQAFPLAIESEDDGGTPGRAGVDYPTLTVIPETSFDCKTQRYKGFFADPETRCQVWHYCDLNGGQASFLCPNGTIFSQAALTCDWWFNVQCDSTHQLYVLNERLYKYILPHQPKFPEDYSGPLVDKYLTLKFKEMEEQFRKNKKGHTEETTEDELANASSEPSTSTEDAHNEVPVTVSEASVVVESPGNSGNVQRLE